MGDKVEATFHGRVAELEAEVKELRERDGRWNKMCVALTDELLVAGAKVAAIEVDSESYSVQQIHDAFEKHAGKDDWGIPSFYEGGLISALRGEYDTVVRQG